jgi:hypothetical protein
MQYRRDASKVKPFDCETRLNEWVLHQAEAVVNRFAVVVASVILVCAAASGRAAQDQPDASGSGPANEAVLPAGTKVELAVTNPIWARTVKPGETLYTQTTFPVLAGDRLAIPAGTYVQGTIESITLPTRKTSRAEVEILFTKVIFADGYVIALPDFAGTAVAAAGQVGGANTEAASSTPVLTAAKVTIEVSRANDLLLDNGAQLEMTLGAPLSLDSKLVAAAIPLTQVPQPGKFKSATLCRPTAGSPGSSGTPDTVIPGTPGTPSTTIPGGPGMPDITIPGTPATPDTVIPGSPGTSGTAGTTCPIAPIVVLSVPITLKAPQSQMAGRAKTN